MKTNQNNHLLCSGLNKCHTFGVWCFAPQRVDNLKNPTLMVFGVSPSMKFVFKVTSLSARCTLQASTSSSLSVPRSRPLAAPAQPATKPANDLTPPAPLEPTSPPANRQPITKVDFHTSVSGAPFFLAHHHIYIYIYIYIYKIISFDHN